MVVIGYPMSMSGHDGSHSDILFLRSCGSARSSWASDLRLMDTSHLRYPILMSGHDSSDGDIPTFFSVEPGSYESGSLILASVCV
jgi:hypothetical protein